MHKCKNRSTLYGSAARIVARHGHTNRETINAQRLTKRVPLQNLFVQKLRPVGIQMAEDYPGKRNGLCDFVSGRAATPNND